jgi:hypothetical protein
VLRHPPCHSDLNPTERIWGRLHVRTRHLDVEKLQKDWENVSDHAARLISKLAYPKTLLDEIMKWIAKTICATRATCQNTNVYHEWKN